MGIHLKFSKEHFLSKTLIHFHLQSKIKLFYFMFFFNCNYLSVWLFSFYVIRGGGGGGDEYLSNV